MIEVENRAWISKRSKACISFQVRRGYLYFLDARYDKLELIVSQVTISPWPIKSAYDRHSSLVVGLSRDAAVFLRFGTEFLLIREFEPGSRVLRARAVVQECGFETELPTGIEAYQLPDKPLRLFEKNTIPKRGNCPRFRGIVEWTIDSFSGPTD